MKRGSAWLSEGAEALALQFEQWQALTEANRAQHAPPQFDVVVVGSGYGGAVAAQRLSALATTPGGQRLRIAVLERGREYLPGNFPDRFADLVGHLRVNGAGTLGAPTNPEGLMDWRLGGDVGALVANGLGGGSLINAGVCEPADHEVLRSEAWPEPWRGNRPLWQQLYARAQAQLGAVSWPRDGSHKQRAMEQLAERLDARALPVMLSIVSPAGTATGQAPADGSAPGAPCLRCGDCFTGCNVGAKRTLGHTYLYRARGQGARLFTGATVHSVQALADAPDDGAPRWVVRWRLTDPNRLPGGTQLFEVRARHVVLAAGTFGSTEILMRSREHGLAVSGQLGEGFSANGDLLSAYHDIGADAGCNPSEDQPLADRLSGPTITTQLHWQTLSSPAAVPQRHTLQDLTVPGALGWLFSEVLSSMAVPHRWTRWHFGTERVGQPDRYAVDAAAMARSLLTVAYVDDGASGRLEPSPGWASALRDGELCVRWKHLGDAGAFLDMDSRLADATPPGALFMRNPLWQFMPENNYFGLGQTNRRLLTVHPLGGCRMAESARDGVVDPWGRVFDCRGVPDDTIAPLAEHRRKRQAGDHQRLVHAGLRVLDGSIVPAALGINPLLTITALAEGAIDQWITDEGWVAADPLLLATVHAPKAPVPPATRAAEVHTAIRLQEVMAYRQPGTGLGARVLQLRAEFDTIPDLPAFLAKDEKSTGFSAELEWLARTPRTDKLTSAAQPALKLRGTVRWMATEPSSVLRRLARGLLTGWLTRWQADEAEARHQGRGALEGGLAKLRGLTHFGAVRLLDYRFEPLQRGWAGLPAGTVLRGTKRLGYRLDVRLPPGTPPTPANQWRALLAGLLKGPWREGLRAVLGACFDLDSVNPWRQLGEMDLWADLPDGQGTVWQGRLAFDELAALDRYDLPLKVSAQANAVAAMRDTLRLGLYFGRVLFGLHMFSFRRAEYPAEINGPRGLQRLPPTVLPADDPRFAGLQLTPHTLNLPSQPGEEPVQLRLTHLRRPDLATPGLPVVLIHGFGSGGVQFTHPTIPEPMAPWLARQGHDVWVVDLRTSIGLQSVHRQWSMDEVARRDVPALIREVCRLSGQPQVQVVAHCIGSAMFCMAALGGHLRGTAGQPLVAGAVLMQVGPKVELPRASRARAYVAMRLRQVMRTATADSVASQKVDDMEALSDRLFGSLLYPPDQRAHYRLGDDLQRNTARVNANRSAAVFGQLFQYENMTPALLAALPDLLGPCNLTTYEQTAQYAFEGRLTDQAGEDTYVTEARLRAHFTFPVTLVHGLRNRTFDRRTIKRNLQLLRGAGVLVQAVRIPGHGHLDCVVGQAAHVQVFPYIDAHLRAVGAMGQGPSSSLPVRRRHIPKAQLWLPRVGPWLGEVRPHASRAGWLTLRIGLRLDEPGRALRGVFSVLCDQAEQAVGAVVFHPVPATHHHELVIECDVPAQPGGAAGSLRLLVASLHNGNPGDPPPDVIGLVRRKTLELDDLTRRTMRPPLACEGLQLDRDWLTRQGQPGEQLGLVLGACRQRPLLVDRLMADRSLAQVCTALDEPAHLSIPPGHAPIDAVLLAGDQVYVDSQVDHGDAGALRRVFLDAHHEAWSAPAQRDLMRRRPTLMVVDDHEFRNDYNNLTSQGRPKEFRDAKAVWQHYQMAAGPALPRPGVSWRSTRLRGFALFLADTRSERKDPATVSRQAARIMGPVQMRALRQWLLALHRSADDQARPKLILMGTPVAPWFKDEAQGLGSDGWQRFPHSVAQLLGFIARHQIQHVVFLSGDYHRAVQARLTLRSGTGAQEHLVSALSIVTGGLYSPYPFANATPDEWLQGQAAQDLAAGHARWGYTLLEQPAGSGYTRLTLFADGTRAAQSDFVPV